MADGHSRPTPEGRAFWSVRTLWRAAEGLPARSVRIAEIAAGATGWVAGCSKLGGLIAQGLSVLALIPALDIAALSIAIPAALSLLLIAFLGRETRNRDLRELEAAVTKFG